MTDIRESYLKDVVRQYRNYKALGEKALAQIPDEHLHTELDSNSNSVAVIVKHVAGNLRSRFADFLTSDGEKPDRDRDAEFEMPERVARATILAWWESGWTTALEAIEGLRPADLDRTITIRQEPFLVIEALNRSITHTAYHMGQIAYLARHFAGDQWTSLSIPKGQSKQFQVGTVKQEGIAR